MLSGQAYRPFDYAGQIRTPAEIGMSDRGTLQQLGRNVEGLASYVELLVAGGGKASRSGQPLGDRQFLQTGAHCRDEATNSTVDRFIFVDHVPQGHIPLVSSAIGVNFKDARGLLPGALESMGQVLDPGQLFRAFTSGSQPPCRALTMQTIGPDGVPGQQTEFVATQDIADMDACSFPDKRNPVTGQRCRETFVSREAGSAAARGARLRARRRSMQLPPWELACCACALVALAALGCA